MPRVLPLALALALALASGTSCEPTGAPPGPPRVPRASQPVPDADEPVPRGRLPADVRPRHYTLELELVPDRKTFRGVVAIDVTLQEPRRMLWLHGDGLTAQKAEVTPKGGVKRFFEAQ